MTYQLAIQWLYSTQAFGMKLGLDNLQRLIREIDAMSINDRRIVHIAGTNGKGSTCAMVDAIFQVADAEGANWRPGRFTSPHLVSFRERIQVGGEMIPESRVAEILTKIRDSVADWEQHPTFFEITLALACRHFIEEDCEVVILETGMGGRLDATNAFASDITAIMPVGLDHQQWLGATIGEIAGEKAGIIKQGVPVVMAPQSVEAAEVIRTTAVERQAPLIEVTQPVPSDWKLGLAGDHQRVNAAVARAIVQRIAPEISSEIVQQGLVEVSWPARFQRLQEERIVIDGAHNVDAAVALVETWVSKYPNEKATVIFGSVEGKDLAGVLAILRPLAERFFFVKVNSQRGRATADLLQLQAGVAKETLTQAIAAAAELPERVLICGSLFLAGEALAQLDSDQYFESSEQ